MSNEVRGSDGVLGEVHAERRRSVRTVQVLFAMLSLAMLAVGLAINWFAARTGLPREITDAAAFGMLLAAVAHATALWLWDR
jgi:hypothetical protein